MLVRSASIRGLFVQVWLIGHTVDPSATNNDVVPPSTGGLINLNASNLLSGGLLSTTANEVVADVVFIYLSIYLFNLNLFTGSVNERVRVMRCLEIILSSFEKERVEQYSI